ncbi:MAG: putative lipid II flippase FtsW [bacterium]
MQPKKRQKLILHAPDWAFVALVWIIIAFGLIMLASAGVSLGYENYGNPNYFLKQQVLFGVLPGICIFIFTFLVDYHFWQKFSKHLFAISVVLLILVFVPSLRVDHGGASRWLNIGGFSFQPSELVKLTFLFFLADWLSTVKASASDFKHHFIPFAVMLGGVAGLILLQPDMGTAFMVVVIGLISYFVANGNLFYLSSFSAAGSILFFILIKTEGYRMQRLTTFLHPELDPLGIGYHINQAILAVGSGGIFGRGYGQSRQKFMYLPEVVSDSIFAIIAEEMGFISVVFLILLFFGLFWKGFKIGEHAPDLFGKLLAIGISSWIILQFLINIGSMIGLMPMTGIPLPFISYGRSSFLVLAAGAGIVANISRQTKAQKQ